MKNRLSLASLAFTASLSVLGTPVLAQEVDITASCVADFVGCSALVQAQIAAFQAAGLSGGALDSAIAQIAASVYRAAQTSQNPTALNALAATLNVAASRMSTPAAANGVREAARTVASGEAATTQPTAFGLSQPTTTPATSGVPASGT